MSKILIGEEKEKIYSQEIHSQGIPLLVSPLILREVKAGQIDIAVYMQREKMIKVYELKSYAKELSRGQFTRLRNSCTYLSRLFNCGIRFELE